MTALDREELIQRFARPIRVDNRDDNVLVFRHESLYAAEAYALSNQEHYDHPSTVEWSPQLKAWLSLVDIGPAIERRKKALEGKID